MKSTKTLVSLICVLALCLGLMAGCGSKTPDAPSTDAPTNAPTNAPEQTTAPAVQEDTTAPAWDAAAALEALVAANPAEDNYLVLSGIGGGWAPVVMVLDNDGNFICLVDYAGQATVNFASGTYEEAEDGSITATGTQYNTGEELIYEIACADGTYTTNVEVPDAGCSADLTGTK